MRKILIADNEKASQSSLVSILSDEYEIIEVGNVNDALKIINSSYSSISAILFSVCTSDMNGYKFLVQKHENVILSKIPFIAILPENDGEAKVKSIAMGANDFITKPFIPQLVLHCLQQNITMQENSSSLVLLQFDALTGLYKREAFLEIAEKMIKEHASGYYTLSYFDIESFKVINDQYGTETGDKVLKHVSRCMKQCADANEGICCRITADDFAMLYPVSCINIKEIIHLYKKATMPPCINQKIRIRIGKYYVDDLSLPVSAMFDRAMMANESIKGRYDVPCIAEYTESMRSDIVREQKIVNEMDEALKLEQFEPWLQPQYNHATGAMIGAEALARWKKGDSFISPAEFVPVFEKNGFIYEMDQYIWEAVCKLLRRWLDEGRDPLPVSVNVSRRDLFHKHCIPVLEEMVKKYNLPHELLRLEVTESAFAESSKLIIAKAEELIRLGFTVEIDDFGSGYSSLNTLKDVPASILKLDMKFFDNTKNTQRGGNIIESVVRMAKWLGMSVIAEGVEKKEQADFLKSIGCYYIQGFYYARPMPVSEYEKLLDKRNKEPELTKLKTLTSLNNNEFWNPQSMETLIFNSYVGGACIFEYHNNKTELLRVNEQYSSELGYFAPKKAVISDQSAELYLDKDNHEKMISNIKRAIETQKESFCELVLSDEEQHVEFIRSTVRVIANTGDRYLLYCVIVNMTEQRIAEKKLIQNQKETRQRYEHELQLRHEILKNSAIYYTVNLTTGIIEDFHSRVDNIPSMSPMQHATKVFRKIVLDHVIEEDRSAVCDALFLKGLRQSYSNSETKISLEFRRLINETEYHWMQATGSLARRPDTDDIIAFMYILDIDRQKKDMLALESVINRELESVSIINVKSGLQHMINVKYKQNIVEIGELFEHDTLMMQIIDFGVAPEDKMLCRETLLLKNMKARLDIDGAFTFSFKIHGKNGMIQQKRTFAYYLDDTHEDIVISDRDITNAFEEEQAQKKLLQMAVDSANKANHAKSVFLSRISNDMYTPLNGIIEMSRLARTEKDPERTEMFLQNIDISGHILLGLINNILNASKIEISGVALNEEPFLIEDFIHNINVIIKPVMDSKEINFSINMNCEAKCIMADNFQFTQFFFNLLSHAIKYTRSGGSIEFTSIHIPDKNGKHGMRFSVRNCGVGISEELISKIISSSNNKEDVKESYPNIGLKIMRKFVDAMDGNLAVKSEHGNGVEFLIDLFAHLCPEKISEHM